MKKTKTENTVEKKKPDEDWMTKKWRPLMAMMYMTCCLADFFLFPIMFTVVQFWETQAANDAFRQWVPITLQGGGLFHVAMGAVLGVTAYGRTQEKLGGAANVSTTPTQPTTPSISAPAGGFGNSTPSAGFSSPGFGSSPAAPSSVPTSSFGGSSFQDTTPAVTTGFGGKPAPVIPPFPEK